MGNVNCDNCGGFSTCTNACYMHLGKALVDFINRIDVVETRIGELEARNLKGDLDLVVSGHQLYGDGESGWILTDISTMIDKSDKFLTAYDMTAFQIAKKYLEKAGVEQTEIEETLEKIRQINKNKLFIVPFKPNTMCLVESNEDDIVSKGEEAQIHSVRWNSNETNHKFNMTILFEMQNANKRIQKYNVTEYLDKFSLTQIDMQTRASKVDKKLIKIDNSGIIRPIVIKQGDIQLALDGTYLYRITAADISIVGVWGNGDKLLYDTSIKSEALEKIKNNENFIKCHKKYIAPYMLYTPNVVEI